MVEMSELVIYFVAYLIGGVTLKLGDDLLDELDNPDAAWVPLAISGFCFGYLMSISEWDLVLFTAILIGVILGGKVNKPQFLVGFFVIAVVLIVLGLPIVTDVLEWFTLLFMLFIAASLDEYGNDWIDRGLSPRAAIFFQYRFALKVTALFLVVPWPEFLLTALGLWVFDSGYELTGWAIRMNQ